MKTNRRIVVAALSLILACSMLATLCLIPVTAAAPADKLSDETGRKTTEITLSDGTKIEGDYIFGAVSNSTRFGGVLNLSKEYVDLRDGKLELLLIRAPKDILELADCVRAMQQQTYDNDMITFLKDSHFEITAPKSLPWTLDGEKQTGTKEIEIQCLHNAISIYQHS